MLYTIIFIILFFIFLTVICYNSNWIALNKKIYNKNFVIIGHRGYHKQYYENTMLAFSKALDFNIDGIELDVQKTLDNKLIVFHDFNLSKLNRPNQLVKDSRWNEIKNYQLGKK